MKCYNLDPTHYYSAPGLSWDAMLKMTKIELEKISDPDMHLFIENGMRGGVCQVSKRHSKANNKCCKNYDPNKSEKWIKYHNMNNLYRKVMMQCLPYGGFKCISVTDKHINTVLNKRDNSKYGYFLEIDAHHPEELHNLHNDLPMAPEKIKVAEDTLSPLQLEIKNKYDIKVGTTKKLIPNLLPIKNYIVHYKNLKYYTSQGLIITKVHKILEFKQSPWMKSYIEFNTEKRMEATNESDKIYLN